MLSGETTDLKAIPFQPCTNLIKKDLNHSSLSAQSTQNRF
jgi:hypothetical protein